MVSYEQHTAGERAAKAGDVLRLGGAMAVLGGLGYFTTLLVHGDLPDRTAQIALEHIAGRSEWRLLKLSLIVSSLLWAGTFVALASSLRDGMSTFLSRLAAAVLLIGVTLPIVEYSVIGYEMKRVADAWASAAGEEQAELLLTARALLGVSGGLFRSFIAWMYGLPFVLMGLAVASSGIFPRVLGWVVVIPATGALFSGTTMFLGLDFVPFPVLYGGFVVPITVWLVVMGAFMWRRGGSGRRPRGRS